MSVTLSLCLAVSLSVCLSVCLSACLSLSLVCVQVSNFTFANKNAKEIQERTKTESTIIF